MDIRSRCVPRNPGSTHPRLLTAVLVLSACQSPPTGLEDPFAQITACFDVPAADEQACLDEFITAYALDTGLDTRGLLAEMERARQEDITINGACHPIAHAIGRWTFQELGQVGDSFNACDQSCHSGCFHGVMERLFTGGSSNGHISVDELRARVPTICADENFEDPTPAEIFQCLHGLGHAVLYTVDYELTLGLQVCDSLSDIFEQQICGTGVVMENITAFDKEKRDIDPDNPLYPCDSITGRYRATCYRMQTSLMLEYGMSLAEIRDQCLLADAYSDDCFVSLGRDYSAFFLSGAIAEAVEACEVYSAGYESSCISGMTVALVDNTWDARFAYPYCNLLIADFQPTCYRSVNYYLTSMYGQTPEQVATQCTDFAREGEDVCLANLPPAAR